MSKRISKKLVIILVLTLTFIIVLSGCSDPAIQEPGDSEENVSSNEGNDSAATLSVMCTVIDTNEQGEAFHEFLKENLNFNIDFEPSPLSYADTVNKMTTMLASGDDSIDVLHIDEIMQLAFTSSGFLEPIDDVITEDELSQFLPGYEEKFLRYKGTLYAIPADIGGIMFFVNKPQFEVAGLSYPTNKQEFIDAAVALTKDGKYGLLESWDKSSHLQDCLNRWCLMFGGNYYDWTLQESQEAIKFMYDLVNTYKVVNPDNISDNYETSNQKMVDGLGAMYFQWGGCTRTFIEAGKYGTEIECAPIPTFKTNHTPMSSWMWVINKNSKNIDVAKQYVKLMASPEANAFFQKVTWKSPPANVKTWDDENLVEGLNLIEESKINMDSFIPRTLTSRHSEYMDTVTGILQRYLVDEISFEECIDQGQAEIDKIMDSLE